METDRPVARVCQHQLSFLFYRLDAPPVAKPVKGKLHKIITNIKVIFIHTSIAIKLPLTETKLTATDPVRDVLRSTLFIARHGSGLPSRLSLAEQTNGQISL